MQTLNLALDDEGCYESQETLEERTREHWEAISGPAFFWPHRYLRNQALSARFFQLLLIYLRLVGEKDKIHFAVKPFRNRKRKTKKHNFVGEKAPSHHRIPWYISTCVFSTTLKYGNLLLELRIMSIEALEKPFSIEPRISQSMVLLHL